MAEQTLSSDLPPIPAKRDAKGRLKSEKSKAPEDMADDINMSISEVQNSSTTNSGVAGLREALAEVVAILKS
ncbi:MAG: hypothetical protein EBU69_03250 [Methylophilaceae bacterium]|nr:hypothetical protein [Methylophilaceae bacterium]